MDVPPLRQRLVPFLLAGYAIGAIRIGLDFFDREAAMWFGLYYAMPVAILWIGVTRKWGIIGWKDMAKTMAVAAPLVFGVWAVIAYTTGQFMEWTDGRYFPGERVVLESGEVEWRNGRAAPLADSAGMKIAMGALHGVITSLIGIVWCTLFGTLFVWVYRPPTPSS